MSETARFASRSLHLRGGCLLFVLGWAALLGAAAACGSAETRAPRVVLSATFDSPEALARRVLAGLEALDAEGLAALPLRREEFLVYVWPHLPASRPERGVPFEYAWAELDQKSRLALARVLHERGGEPLSLVSVDLGRRVSEYGRFRVYREPRVVVRDEASGETRRLALFGSILEYEGRYKLFSYVVD